VGASPSCSGVSCDLNGLRLVLGCVCASQDQSLVPVSCRLSLVVDPQQQQPVCFSLLIDGKQAFHGDAQ
jgi:hypothetical protein